MLTQFYKSYDDRQLVKTFLNRRNEEAFLELYHRYMPGLYQLTLRMVRWNVQVAEDIVQDTWVRAIERLPDFRWQASLRTWLSAIAINRCREFFRKQDRMTNDLPEGVVEARDITHLDLERAISILPPGYRQVLILHDIEGYTHEEISNLLEIDSGTSKSQLSRARRAVRTTLQTAEAGAIDRS